MLRNFRAFIILAVFFWQSLAMLGTASIAQLVDASEHAVVHLQDSDHHHHADQSLHMEDDGTAVHHLHPDLGNHTAGLSSAAFPEMARVRSVSPVQMAPVAWCAPCLEGPLRPPMQRA